MDFGGKDGFNGVVVEGWNEGWEEWFGKRKEYVFEFVSGYGEFDVEEIDGYGGSKGIEMMMDDES